MIWRSILTVGLAKILRLSVRSCKIKRTLNFDPSRVIYDGRSFRLTENAEKECIMKLQRLIYLRRSPTADHSAKVDE